MPVGSNFVDDALIGGLGGGWIKYDDGADVVALIDVGCAIAMISVSNDNNDVEGFVGQGVERGVNVGAAANVEAVVGVFVGSDGAGGRGENGDVVGVVDLLGVGGNSGRILVNGAGSVQKESGFLPAGCSVLDSIGDVLGSNCGVDLLGIVVEDVVFGESVIEVFGVQIELAGVVTEVTETKPAYAAGGKTVCVGGDVERLFSAILDEGGGFLSDWDVIAQITAIVDEAAALCVNLRKTGDAEYCGVAVVGNALAARTGKIGRLVISCPFAGGYFLSKHECGELWCGRFRRRFYLCWGGVTLGVVSGMGLVSGALFGVLVVSLSALIC